MTIFPETSGQVTPETKKEGRSDANVLRVHGRQAKALQSSLQALAERIEAVKSDHDKLESENRFLQDYIGGLTRNMTKSEMTRSSTKVKKSQK
jgi:hypothetical protein